MNGSFVLKYTKMKKININKKEKTWKRREMGKSGF